MPDDFRVSFLQGAAQPAVVFGAGDVVRFDSPAAPEQVFFAVRRVRAERTALR
jgi:hypothetical protein